MKKTYRHFVLLSVIAVLAIATVACGSITTLKNLLAKDTPQPASTATSIPLPTNPPTDIPTTAPVPTDIPEPTNTSEPAVAPTEFIGGECDPSAQRLEVNQEYLDHLQGAAYPQGCHVYCIWVPDGSRLELGIKDFSIDLDIYIDKDLSVLEYSDHGQWQSNDFGTGDESVTISNPEGRYYMQVCSYDPSSSVESDFTIYSEFSD